MSTDIINSAVVQKLKAIADAIFKAANAPDSDEDDQLSFIESWAAAVASRPDLQAQLAQMDGSIVPHADGTLVFLPVAPINPKGETAKMRNGTVRSVRESLNAQNRELSAVVAARQRATGRSFDECWRAVLSERPDLRQYTNSAGFLMTPSE